jgi:hypothetical protein
VRERGVLLDWGDFSCPQVRRDVRWAGAIIATAGAGSFAVHGLVRAWIHRWLAWSTTVYVYVAYQTLLLAGVVGFCYASPIAPLPTATALLLVAVIMLKSHSFVATNYAIYCEHVARYGTMLLESRLSPRHGSHHGRPASAPAGTFDAFLADGVPGAAAAAAAAAAGDGAPAAPRPHSTAAVFGGSKGAPGTHASSAHGSSPARAAAAARRRLNSSSSAAALVPPDSARSTGTSSVHEDGAAAGAGAAGGSGGKLTRSASRGQLRQRRRAKVGSSGSLTGMAAAASAAAPGKARAGSPSVPPVNDSEDEDADDRPSMDPPHLYGSGSANGGGGAYQSDSRDYGGDNEREDGGGKDGTAAVTEDEGRAFSGLSPLPSPTATAGAGSGRSATAAAAPGATGASHLPQPLTLPSTATAAGASGEGATGLSELRPPPGLPALDVTAAAADLGGGGGNDEGGDGADGGGDTPWPDHGTYADVPTAYAHEVAAAADDGGGRRGGGVDGAHFDGTVPPLLAALGGQPDIISGTREQKRRLIKAWPHNVTVRDFAYFLLAPTLVYEPRYPRTKAVRWRYVAHKSAQLALTLAAQYALLKQFLLPTLQHPSPPSSPALAAQASALVFDVMRLAIPSLTVWLLMFYSFFHCAMNITAELLRFADRCVGGSGKGGRGVGGGAGGVVALCCARFARSPRLSSTPLLFLLSPLAATSTPTGGMRRGWTRSGGRGTGRCTSSRCATCLWSCGTTRACTPASRCLRRSSSRRWVTSSYSASRSRRCGRGSSWECCCRSR